MRPGTAGAGEPSVEAIVYGIPSRLPRSLMPVHDSKIIDRQVGRNAQLFARSIAALDAPEQRYPYLRILVSLIEVAHPEWNQAPNKDQQIAELVVQMSEGALDQQEVADVVRVRDEERGITYE